ncbi:DUF1904 domain-containing protein [Clostridium magnum]|uniref:DUF1904 domain-containing protein n=1 Tax=Clostridium magnum DSM 2767 TaxID=1121326 RepID=A0A161X756_9CLOT|nr:DUF1904 domain-containing protein [Clostridium magnum]KZL89936.1 hypothetical protein CLMAG_44120 [Clostridium magnum DSM 2767]SHJ66509.1 protein of unknown function [Clostridium magnum DSM 2767]
MPQIKIRGIDIEKISTISTNMIDQLEQIIDCPRDYFTIECISSTFIKNGKVDEGYPFIEVVWFDRGQQIQDNVAKSITNLIHNLGYKNVDVFFTVLKENLYYENGDHF